MTIDELIQKKKTMLYGEKSDKLKACNCLKDYRQIIEIYKLIEMNNVQSNQKCITIKKLRLIMQSLILIKKLDIIWARWKKYEKSYNASIPISADVPLSTIFPHQLSNIFISAHSKIGEGCIIFQGVTIGSNTLSDSKNHGSPVIGNNVYIGSGATIIGDIVIGDNVRIGANTTVTKSIESNYTCVSQPNILIKHMNKKENKQW